MNKKRTTLFTAILAFSILFCDCSRAKKSIANDIKVETYTLERSFEGDSTTPSIFLSTQLAYPTEYKDEKVLESIQTAIVRSALGDKAINSPEAEMERFTENAINEHKRRIEERRNNLLLEDGDCVSDIFHRTSQEVAFNRDGIFSILTADTSHYGGTKGINSIYYDNYDLQTGAALSYNDLFIEDSEEIVASSILQKLMEDNHIEKADSLEEIGFMEIGEIKPNNNFLIDGNGITFVYNPSEIACLALGIVKVFLPYRNLGYLLKEDAPIRRFSE